MAKKNYKVILLGKIAEGYDAEIARDNLAIVFEIDLKKIPKLLKKPIVIRKNLTKTDAEKYQHGLEKIGIPCQITDGSTTSSISQPEPPAKNDTKAEEKLSLVEQPSDTLVLTPDTLRVIDVKIPFGAMIILIIRWTLASIPALIIFGAIGYLLQLVANDFIQELLATLNMSIG